ncbi:protein kinase domain-containing protein [Streptomyces subrutilus]|uniref:serine/threonine-protein kinase n=1 Tax=Streptomyces subrutilus TaxID=36818 RepID=UPI000AE3F5A9|nr:PQQ-binding-like beta-propeller repeat protein [Streptomyces subrutilus]
MQEAGSEQELGADGATVVLPAVIGPYVVMRPLGGGGMGVVSLCRTGSGRLVAVKQVREEYADDPAFRSRFRREVAAARRVSGVYTVPVLDADTDGPRPWVATAYVPGPTLDQALRICGTFQEPAVRALGTALAESLQVIHAAGLVHRDFKPGNVLLSSDGPRVIDFGISKALGETRLTVTGTVIGSPAFMAPEQIASFHDAGPESDVFALAGVLVYAACGEGPFGPGDHSVLHRIVTDEPNLQAVPSALHPLLLRCLDKTPARRPPLDAVLAGLAPARPHDLLVPALHADLAERARDAEQMAVAPPPPRAVPDGGRERSAPSRRTVLLGGLAAAALAGGGVAGAVWGPWKAGDGGGKNAGPAPSLGPTARPVVLTDPPAPLWNEPLPDSPSGMPQLRATGGTLVLQDSSFGGYTVAAFDSASGKLRWSQSTATAMQLNQPSGALPRGTRVLGPIDAGLLGTSMSTALESMGQTSLTVLDPATARVRSTLGLPKGDHVVTLLSAHENMAYCLVNTFKGGLTTGAPSPAATAGPDLSETVTAIDLNGGDVRWRKPVVPNSMSQVRYAADRHGFYYTESTKTGLTLYAVHAADGTPRWSVDVAADPNSQLPPYMQAGGGSLTSSLIAVGDLLIAMHQKAGMSAYDAESGQRRWALPMAGASVPIAVGDLLLVNDFRNVHAVDLHSGEIRWRVESPVPLSPLPAFSPTLAASTQVTVVLFSPAISGLGISTGEFASGCLVLRTSDGKQLWALRDKPVASASSAPVSAPGSPAPSPSGIGEATRLAEAFWGVWAQDDVVFVSGGGRVRAYRADAG